MLGEMSGTNRMKLAFIIALMLPFAFETSSAQSKETPLQDSQLPTLTSRSNLVLVPVLVKSKAARIVFSLTADDFILTDNGVSQPVRIEEGALGQPLALAVIVQTGGQATAHLRDYRNLGGILDAVIGGVSHRVAVIAFDSKPRIEQDFTPDTDAAAETIAGLPEGDTGAAILDALNFGIQLLRNQPSAYRRAVLLFSETADRGSQTSLEDAVRAVEETNTAIYSFGFRSEEHTSELQSQSNLVC